MPVHLTERFLFKFYRERLRSHYLHEGSKVLVFVLGLTVDALVLACLLVICSQDENWSTGRGISTLKKAQSVSVLAPPSL
jgi:hypothetical protein